MIGRLLSILLCFPSRKRKSPKKSKGNAPSSELNTLTQPGNKTIPGSSEEPVVTTSEPGSNNPQSQWNNLRPDFQSARSSNSAGVSKAADTDKGLSINTTAISQGATSDIGIGNSRPSIESHGTSLQERNKTSSPVPSVRQDMHKLQREIQKELNRLKKPSDGPKSTIILHRDLMDFWSHPKWAPFIIDQSWWSELNDNVVHHVHPMTKYWKAFSILILVNFSEWDRFHSMFIYPQRSDSRLPFPLVDLIDETFLGSHLGSLFYEAQWAFCPFVITERQDPLVLRDMNLDCRFPFIAKSKKVGDGGSGFVSKQVVAPGYLRTNHGSSVNHKVSRIIVH
jgi:hypothetical protein